MSRRWLRHFMQIAGILVLAGMNVQAARDSRPADVTIYVNGDDFPPIRVDFGARATVTWMYARIGIRLAWRNDAPGNGTVHGSPVPIQMRFAKDSPRTPAGGFGVCAAVCRWGYDGITVIYDRIRSGQIDQRAEHPGTRAGARDRPRVDGHRRACRDRHNEGALERKGLRRDEEEAARIHAGRCGHDRKGVDRGNPEPPANTHDRNRHSFNEFRDDRQITRKSPSAHLGSRAQTADSLSAAQIAAGGRDEITVPGIDSDDDCVAGGWQTASGDRCLPQRSRRHFTTLAPGRVASHIFRGIGVRVKWHTGDCTRPGVPDKVRPFSRPLESEPWNTPRILSLRALSRLQNASARPGGNHGLRGPGAELLADHPRLNGSGAGYVLAHELAHVMQGIVRHSESGILKANWSSGDFSEMMYFRLSFTRFDVELIHQGLALQLASRRSEPAPRRRPAAHSRSAFASLPTTRLRLSY